MIFPKIQDFIAEQLSINKDIIKLTSKLYEDLGIDSIDAISIVIKVEKFFQISINDDDLKQLKTVQDIVEYIKKYSNYTSNL